MAPSLSRRLAGETIGTAFLLLAVVGSGIMGERLAGGNVALALLANAIATGCALVVLITIFAPLSGAHFNPAVSLYVFLRGEMKLRAAASYALAQSIGAVAGVWLAHLLFEMDMLQTSSHARDGGAQFLSEMVATLLLLGVIAGGRRAAPEAVPLLVGLTITGAYWFTASTSFANPAVTMARALTDTFSGIAPHSAPLFIAAQLGAALAASLVLPRLFSD